MSWLQSFQLRHFVRRSLWITPVLALGLVFIVAPLLLRLDPALGWRFLDFTPEGARAILSAFTVSMLTLVVFVVSSLLIIVQLASAQLTPRIIAMVLVDKRLKWVLSLFTFAYCYTIAASGRIEATVPQLPVTVAICCNLACIGIFFWYAQWLGSAMRPISVLQAVANDGRSVVESVYPERFDPAEKRLAWSPAPDAEVVVVEQTGKSGVVLAFSLPDLLALAQGADAVIELVPQVGDYVARGDPLFRIREGARPIDANALRACIATGPERTVEQDPRFAFRIMVDIANKALSPAINDPTTAVLALDQIHLLLMEVGKRRLDTGQTRDAQGHLRLCYRTPDWIDFVGLAVTEIRQFGASSMQVARRLQAMIVHLMKVLPEARQPALLDELASLRGSVLREFPDAQDRARAQIGDLQGLGS